MPTIWNDFSMNIKSNYYLTIVFQIMIRLTSRANQSLANWTYPLLDHKPVSVKKYIKKKRRKNQSTICAGLNIASITTVKVNLFTAPPAYSSHHCHSSFTHTNHLHTVLCVTSTSMPSRCQVVSSVTFCCPPSSSVANFSDLPLCGQFLFGLRWGSWRGFWLFDEGVGGLDITYL